MLIQMNSSQIRQAFLDYFATKKHKIVSSSPLILANDPTLLFTNAGMVQFKDVFLGLEQRDYARAATIQKCLRAGGKHNDLENVGYTARHHTFFEMLGNFSFGDYFKLEAITYAWEFLTTILKLPQDKLWVTVYEHDDEAYAIWLKNIGISATRLSRCGEQDNFWSMGDTGPCGPCTEIFYDHGPKIVGSPPGTENADGDRYVEIWNLVFMQYNRDQNGKLHPLPKPSVDTGMGLERIAAVMQGVHSNYDIDIFSYLIDAIRNIAAADNLDLPAFKVIADHIRACAFLIADGVLPSNEGSGYVLRRIIRRAVRHGSKVGITTPFLGKLLVPLCTIMGAAYPELLQQQLFIAETLTQEEYQFAHTLENGLRILQEYISMTSGDRIPGEIAFKLYDTYGFPIDLTQDIARENNREVDVRQFDICMQQQRQTSKASNKFKTELLNASAISWNSIFQGYTMDSLTSPIIGLIFNDVLTDTLFAGSCGSVILDATPFYAESGGQVGDKGYLTDENGTQFRVDDTQKIGQSIIHHGELLNNKLQVGQNMVATVDSISRNLIRMNHTATHLLHAALKKILGQHVHQKGSLVTADQARFDFSHAEALTRKQIISLEELLNNQVCRNYAVTTAIMNIDAAKQSGAEALFGEKYAESVRVLAIGDVSKELCGGTHVRRTGDIGLIKIIAEYGVASGIRRIEMQTGVAALHWVTQQLQILEHAAQQLKTTTVQLHTKIDQLLQNYKHQEKELLHAKEQCANLLEREFLDQVLQIAGINVLIAKVDVADNTSLRCLLDKLKSKLTNYLIILYYIIGDKINVLAEKSDALINKIPDAAVFVRYLCDKGGGKSNLAQGGGSAPIDIESRIDKIFQLIKSSI